eukprot:9269733-Pyramimonas_sp.AAC.1
MPTVPWTAVTDRGRGERPRLAFPLYGVGKLPCLLCLGRPSRTAVAWGPHFPHPFMVFRICHASCALDARHGQLPR